MTQSTSDDNPAIVEHVPAMIWRAGPDARRNFFNDAWLHFTGRTLEEELGDGWTAGIHPDDAQDYLDRYREHVENRSAFEAEYRLRRADDVYRYVMVDAQPYVDDDGAFQGFVGSCVDIHHLRQHQPSAADDFFEMSLDNVCVTGFDGYFKRVNSSWSRTLGWTPEELLSRPVLDFVHPDDRDDVLASRERLRSGDDLQALMNRYRCKDGSYRWFDWRAVAHEDRGVIYAVARDVTEQKRADERLRQARDREKELRRQLMVADRLASVGTLAAGVAHEINNPLAYIATNIDLILEEITQARESGHRQPSSGWAELTELADDAKHGTERIRKIVSGLKTFSRAEEERTTVIDVLPLLESSVRMATNEIRHRASLVEDYEPLPPVEANRARLGQVFINLLLNAAQALEEGGGEANEIRVVAHTDSEGRAAIEVHDTGEGIPDDVIDRVFDPFFTTKPVGVGTGLGLSMCHSIVTNIGGEISVSSEDGGPTIVRVVLPPSDAARDATGDDDQSASGPDLACASVLVVDDEPAIGMVIRRVLKDHEVTAVTNAREALELLDSGKSYQIIFSDLMMPEMSGMQFFEEITRRFEDTAERVVFVTGGAFTPKAHAFLDDVPNEVLEKPFTPDAIRKLVQRYAPIDRSD